MSHIEEMIRELCPNGVEYKKLKNTTTITRGVRVVKSQLQSIGSYPVYQNSLTPMGYYYLLISMKPSARLQLR